MARAGKVTSRVYMIVQYEENPLTGEDLGFNEEAIKAGIAKRESGLLSWAYVRHDKDLYLEGDDIPEGKEVGDVRPPHWHVVLQFKSQAELPGVAKAFGVGEQYVDKMTGNGAFYDGVYYLTHEDDKQRTAGKHVYGRDEVILPAGAEAEIWETIEVREAKRMKKMPQSLSVERYMSKLANGEMTLSEVYDEDKLIYSKNITAFKGARQAFLRYAKPPLVRANYYMQGEAGAGKTIAAKALARTLFPGRDDDQVFFVVGDGAVPFDGYDGQPVIIWDDWRADDILGKFDRGTAWKLFAINPDKISVSVKYGSVNLVNAVSIVTSVKPFHEFIKGLAGKYVDAKRVTHQAEDINQGYRRFPVFMEISKESYNLYASMALTGGEFAEYARLATVNASMVQLAKNLTADNTQLALGVVGKLHSKVNGRYSKLEEPDVIDVKVEMVPEQIELFGLED